MLKICRIFYLSFSLSLLLTPTCMVAMDGARDRVSNGSANEVAWNGWWAATCDFLNFTASEIHGGLVAAKDLVVAGGEKLTGFIDEQVDEQDAAIEQQKKLINGLTADEFDEYNRYLSFITRELRVGEDLFDAHAVQRDLLGWDAAKIDRWRKFHEKYAGRQDPRLAGKYVLNDAVSAANAVRNTCRRADAVHNFSGGLKAALKAPIDVNDPVVKQCVENVEKQIRDEIARSRKLTEEESGEYDDYKTALLSGHDPSEILTEWDGVKLEKWRAWHELVTSGPKQPTAGDWAIWLVRSLPKILDLPNFAYKYSIGSATSANRITVDAIFNDGNTSFAMPSLNIYSFNPVKASVNSLFGADAAKLLFMYRILMGYASAWSYILDGPLVAAGIAMDIPAVREFITWKSLRFALSGIEKLGWANHADVEYLLNNPDVETLFTKYPLLSRVVQAYVDRYVFRRQIDPAVMKFLANPHNEPHCAKLDSYIPQSFCAAINNFKQSCGRDFCAYMAKKFAMAPLTVLPGLNGGTVTESKIVQPPLPNENVEVVHFGEVVKILKRMVSSQLRSGLDDNQRNAECLTELKKFNSLLGITERIDGHVADAARSAITAGSDMSNKAVSSVVSVIYSPDKIIDKTLDVVDRALVPAVKVADLASVAVDKGLEVAAQAGQVVDEAKKKKSWQGFWQGLSGNLAAPAVSSEPVENLPGQKTQLFFTFCRIANRNPETVQPILDHLYDRWCQQNTNLNSSQQQSKTTVGQAAQPGLAREVWNFSKQQAGNGIYNALRDGIDQWIEGGHDVVQGMQQSIENSFFDALIELDNMQAPVCNKYGQGGGNVPEVNSEVHGSRIQSACEKSKAMYEKAKACVESTKNFLSKFDVEPEEAAVLGRALRSFVVARGWVQEDEFDTMLEQDAPALAECLEAIAEIEASKTPEERAADKEFVASFGSADTHASSDYSSWPRDMNKPLFEIPALNHLSLVLYKKDIALFFIRVLDHYVDKMFFKQIGDHYHKKVCSNLNLKKKKLIAILDTCSQNGQLDVTKRDTIEALMLQEVFIDHCADVLNAGRTSINLKWVLQICLHLFLKHMVYKIENTVNPFNPLKSLLNSEAKKTLTVPEALKNLTLTNAFNWGCDYGIAAGDEHKQSQMTEQLKEDAFKTGKKCLTDWYKNRRINVSVYPLIELFCFGDARLMDFRVEKFYLGSLWAIWFVTKFLNFKFNCPPDWLTNWLTELPYVGPAFRGVPSALQRIPFFGQLAHPISESTLIDWAGADSVCFMIRFVLMARFLSKMNNVYKVALKKYIKENIYRFVKTIADMKHADELGSDEIGFNEITFKDMLKQAHSASFETWRAYKQYKPAGFFGMGAALSLAGTGAGIFSLAIR